MGKAHLQVAAARQGRGETRICVVPAADLYTSLSFLRALRHAAYFLFAVMTWREQAKNNRRILPSCVLSAIRRKFPSADGTYTGFKLFWHLVAVSVDTDVTLLITQCASLFLNFPDLKASVVSSHRWKSVVWRPCVLVCFSLGSQLWMNKNSIITTTVVYCNVTSVPFTDLNMKKIKTIGYNQTTCSFHVKISTRDSHLFKCTLR